MTSHSQSTAVHVPYAFSYADTTARAAATGFVAADVGKLARQLDDNSLWMLTDDSPETWVQVGGGGGGYDEGTSFPGSPSSGDKFYRTDRNLLYFYDGTRWLTVTLYQHFLAQWSGISADTSFYTAIPTGLYDVFVEDLIATMYSFSGLGVGAYWVLSLYYWDGSTQGSAIATVNSNGDTNGDFTKKLATIDALIGTAKDNAHVAVTKTGSPGAAYGGAFMTYRLVG